MLMIVLMAVLIRTYLIKNRRTTAHLRPACERLRYGVGGDLGDAGACGGVCDASGAFGVRIKTLRNGCWNSFSLRLEGLMVAESIT
jgi:hypothetical protein